MFVLRSTLTEDTVPVPRSLWADVRWYARCCGWKAAGTVGASALGAYDVPDVMVMTDDALALAHALGRIDLDRFSDDQRAVIRRVARLVELGEFRIEPG